MGGAVGSIVNQAIAPTAIRRQRKASERALDTGGIGSDYLTMENLLLPYDQLVAMGRIAPGTHGGNMAGLSGNQSVFGRDLGAFENNVAMSDPAYAALRDEMATNLNVDQNGLPADIARGISQGVRSSASSRGMLDSGTAGLQEVAALMGGTENLRSNRIAQVNQFLSNTTNGFIDKLFPGMSTIYQGELQRAIARSGGQLQAIGQGLNFDSGAVSAGSSINASAASSSESTGMGF